MDVVKFCSPVNGDVIFENDKRKDGWKLRREGAVLPTSGRLNFEAVSVLADGEESVKGAVMLGRAAAGNCGGQHLAEHLLKNSSFIPEKLRDRILVFADTEWLDGDYLHVTGMCWDGDEWCLGFRSLDDDWGSLVMFVRVRA